MGGAVITLRGDTEAELRRKVSAHRREARNSGLVEERVHQEIYDPKEKVWKAVLWLHS